MALGNLSLAQAPCGTEPCCLRVDGDSWKGPLLSYAVRHRETYLSNLLGQLSPPFSETEICVRISSSCLRIRPSLLSTLCEVLSS